MQGRTFAPALCVPLLSLLTACPSAPGFNTNTIPASCAEGQILVRGSSQWECGWPPMLALPPLSVNCIDKFGVVWPKYALSSDGNSLTCDVADYRLADQLLNAVGNYQAAADQVATYDPLRKPTSSFYRGVTNALSTGLMTSPGVDNGLPAGAAICAAEYSGSHLCSMFELYDSVSHGVVTKDMRIPKAWIYFPANNASTFALQPTEGLADSCAGYTYDKNDRGWSGIAAEWSILATSYLGLKFYGGLSAPCGSSLPLACCGGAP